MSPSAPSSSSRLPRLVVLVAAFALVLVAMIGAAPRSADAASTKPTLRATTTTTTSVSLRWSSVKKAAGYKIKYSRSSTMSKPAYLRVKKKKTSAVLKGLRSGTTYYVKVRATKKSGAKLGRYSKVVKVRTGAAAVSAPPPAVNTGPQLRVASYNVTCDKCFDGQPNELRWSGRRDAVAANIKAQNLDVIGVQEAGQGWLLDGKGDKIDLSQFEDLRNALGGSWTLTNDKRNNCARSKSPKACSYVDQGASDGTRIFYDAAKVTMLDSGSKLLPTVKGVNDRYVAWARLEQRSTGKQFMFATTQLEHTKDKSGSRTMWNLRRDQARVIAETVKKNNPDRLPALVVGDLNSTRFEHAYNPGNGPYDVLTDAGYVDPLGGAWETTRTAPGATVQKRINTWVDSFNGFERTGVGHPGWINGSYIDYILVSPSIAVKEWETVVKVDAQGNLAGIIPSDHNLIRATVVLP